MRRDFRGRRGSVLLIEGVRQASVAGAYPDLHKVPQGLTPSLQRLEVSDALKGARHAIESVFGVLPALSNPAATGPVVREAQRHLAQWVLTPLAKLIAHEMSQKLENVVSFDVLQTTHAYDAGGRARAALQIVQMMTQAK